MLMDVGASRSITDHIFDAHKRYAMRMTSTSSMNLSNRDTTRRLIPMQGWLWIGVLGVLFILFHRTFLWRMIRIATGQWGGDWSHALIVPVISIYFVSQNRDRLAAIGRRVYWPGLIVLLVGLFGSAWSIYPIRNDMFQGYSMIVCLFGLVLFLMGPAMMRLLWFPIIYLSLGVKISDKYWEQIAWKLQLIAAKSATVVIQCLQVDATVKGSTIEITAMRGGQWVVEKINVAEACSGLRMLMAFIALGAAMAYLTDRAWWKRVVMLVLAVPIAMVVNIGRVTVIGLLTLVDKGMASGDFHVFVGMLMLIPAAGLFMLVGWVLDRVVIDETDSSNDESGADPPSPAISSTAKPVEGRWTRVVLGLVIGGLLTAMIGIEYGLLLAMSRPGEFFGGYLTTGMAQGLGAVGVLLVMVVFWFVIRLVRPESGINRGPSSVSLGMSMGVLLTSVLGLNGVVQATRTVLIKKAVPLRVPLFRIPTKVRGWEMISEDPRLSKEALESLGTKQYISRVYKDTGRANTSAESFARLHVAYYTGTPDTVPHVPDRCFVGAGMDRIGRELIMLELTGPGLRQTDDGWASVSTLNPKGVRLPDVNIQATIFTFVNPARPTQLSNVVYFFAANGNYLPTPEWVRAKGFDPRDRYSYYCKIEVGMFGVGDTRVASERVEAFLSVMLPEIMACLPDWADVTAGRWPGSRNVANEPEPVIYRK